MPQCRSSSGEQFERGRSPARQPKSAHVLLCAGRHVFRRIGRVDRVEQTLAANAARADADLTFACLERAERLLEERAIPAASFVAPRTNEDAAVNDNRPDGDEAVDRPRADAEDLRRAHGRQERLRKAHRGNFPSRIEAS